MDLSNYWIIESRSKFSWLSNKLLKLKHTVSPYLTCLFWKHNWSPLGNLTTFINVRTALPMGIRATATLSDLYYDGVWHLRPARSDNQVLLHVCSVICKMKQEITCFLENLIDQRQDCMFQILQPTAPFHHVRARECMTEQLITPYQRLTFLLLSVSVLRLQRHATKLHRRKDVPVRLFSSRLYFGLLL